jgi:hypothetical protein
MFYFVAILIGLICGGLFICFALLAMHCLQIIDTAGDRDADGLDGPDQF